MKGKRQIKEEYWRSLVKEISNSKEGVEAAYDRAGVPRATFIWWRRKFRKESSKLEKTFHVTEVPLIQSTEVEIRCRNGRSIIIRGHSAADLLRKALQIAEDSK
jgi:hypothetical protein